MAVLKWLLVTALMAAGLVLFVQGLGADVPLLKYAGLEIRSVPGGIAVMLVAVALARLWKITQTTRTITTTEMDQDGVVRKISEVIESTKSLSGPQV